MSLITPGTYREHDPGTSLGDDAIQRLIDANEAHMVRVLGPHSRVGDPAVETFHSLARRPRAITLQQRAASIVSIRERSEDTTSWTVLDAGDFLALDGGQTLNRLTTGINPATRWAALTEVTYVPVANLAERITALLEMVGADAGAGVNSGGIVSRTMGSWSETYGAGEQSAEASKAKILARLHPRAGVVIA